MGVEVAQVVGGTTPSRSTSFRGMWRSSAMVSPCSASSFGSTFSPSGPPRRTPSSQVRWLSPTWSRWTCPGSTSSSRANLRWKPIATLQRPTALCPAWSRARVTMPTGLVKSMIQASGLVRRTRSAMSSTTGTVRSALARPPAPVVSWPTQPHSSGQVSSWLRAACPPTRSWSRTASAPATPASRSVVVVIFPAWSCLAKIRRARPPTSSSRSAAGSTRTSSSTGSVSRSRAKPSISSGV